MPCTTRKHIRSAALSTSRTRKAQPSDTRSPLAYNTCSSMRIIGERQPSNSRAICSRLSNSGCRCGLLAIGGNKYLVGSLELLYPLSKKMGVIVSGFFDAGNSWDEGEMFFSQPHRRLASPSMGLYKSVGVGVRWFSPMGPLRIEFGHGLDKVYDSTSNKVEFGMGQSF